jgi:hypothetical protein
MHEMKIIFAEQNCKNEFQEHGVGTTSWFFLYMYMHKMKTEKSEPHEPATYLDKLWFLKQSNLMHCDHR